MTPEPQFYSPREAVERLDRLCELMSDCLPVGLVEEMRAVYARFSSHYRKLEAFQWQLEEFNRMLY